MSTYHVKDSDGREVLATDDWVEACSAALSPDWPIGLALRVTGTHPTHAWGPPHPGQRPPGQRCTRCDAWDNGSYGSKAPCGYDFGGESLVTALRKEAQARKAAEQ